MGRGLRVLLHSSNNDHGSAAIACAAAIEGPIADTLEVSG